ncbi:alcohol dehydrogenase AdhP [Polycladomyces subterraneus]|uniref:Alcohol dehydrogenase n=1 Tax=Polycladomyces subterraneus TaxID=1016997 RepID=A0ABT8IM37_9BACL|nr:alcohol dehydrogenase AdhP [Polycladomyces subterraneus]MDN4593785.1 alcohol dehydrogenase AdhP [Polycladomyces subterraneus]
MLAAVVRDFAEPVRIEEVNIPEPGVGQVRVKVEASGLCHTDIHAANGEWPVKPKLPFIPGHEGIGIVEVVGKGVTGIKEGDRVALPWLGYACGNCEYCNSGWETLCQSQFNTGYSIDGTHAEYTIGYAKHIVKVPDGISPLDAAPLTCAGVTTYKAVKMSGARPSDLVAIFGIGGLGHLALQYAKVTGATVVAVDLFNKKLQLAKELGADYVVNARYQDPVEEIKKLGGADAAISVAVSPKAFEQAFHSLRRGGRLVLVALPADNYMQLPIFETVFNGIQVIGSIVGTRTDLEETFQLHAEGRTKVIYETRHLHQVHEAFEEVEKAQTKARLVFKL